MNQRRLPAVVLPPRAVSELEVSAETSFMRDTAYNFASQVDREIEALSTEKYLLHKGRAKQLREELLPISRLALHFALPGLSVEVEAFENSGPVDGHISLRGYRNEDFDVEVTYARSHEDSMRRELLHKTGFTPEAGSIYQDKCSGKIIAEQGGRDINENVTAAATTIAELPAKKVSKPYPENTILLIAIDDITFYGSTAWSELFNLLARKGGFFSGPCCRVYLFNCATNEIQIAAQERNV